MSDGHGETTALGVSFPPQPAPRTGYGPDPCCQPCPDCGGLECLCRPRFFAGQLLTEQDLNRLDHYIVEKNKLHNRHLVGWGVVCGLEVLCDQCEDRVRVTPGYALSPCGEDIVVCKTDYVDICALIDQCRRIDQVDCRPYAGNAGCDEVEEDWVLAIRYAEAPSAGITALTGAASCGCVSTGKSSCGCGGGSACSCGTTTGQQAQNKEPPRLRRGAPPSCEPTQVCESYRYEIFRAPEEEPKDDRGGRDEPGSIVGSFSGITARLDGELARRITCCLREVEQALPKPPGRPDEIQAGDRQAWYRWACAVKRSLAAYYARIGGGNCEAVAKLGAIPIPPPTMELDAFKQAIGEASLQLVLVALEAMLHCICSNLLPPCPPPEDPRVPLAIVTVRRKGCDIVKVCNWTPLRRHVTTFRTLDYWFGWLPLRKVVRNAIEAMCCDLFGLFDQFEKKAPVEEKPSTGQPPPPPPVAVPVAAPAAMAAPAAAPASDATESAAEQFKSPLETHLDLHLGQGQGANTILARAALAGLGGDGPTVADLFDLTFQRRRFATGDAADEADSKRMTDSLAQSGLLRTFAGLVQASGAPDRAARLFGGGSTEGRGDELSELRARLDRQDAEIAALRQSVKRVSAKRKGGG